MPFIEAGSIRLGQGAATVTNDRDAVFVHIQKTGGTSILKAFGQDLHPRYKHCLASDFVQMYGAERWNDAFTFAFVRNPWARLVSWWSMIDSYRTAYRQGARLNRFFTYIFENSETFEDFILNCHADIADPDGRKCILRNQLDYVTDADGAVIVDFVGTIENLDAGFDQVTRSLGLPDIVLEHRNRSSHSAYTDYYSPRTRKLVEEAYARDIAHFGYVFGQDAT